MLSCLGTHEKTYKKNELILRAGDPVQEIGMVESGSANIVVNFYWGSSNIFGHIEQGRIFAENYAAIPGKELLPPSPAKNCSVMSLLRSRARFFFST